MTMEKRRQDRNLTSYFRWSLMSYLDINAPHNPKSAIWIKGIALTTCKELADQDDNAVKSERYYHATRPVHFPDHEACLLILEGINTLDALKQQAKRIGVDHDRVFYSKDDSLILLSHQRDCPSIKTTPQDPGSIKSTAIETLTT